MKFEYKFVDGMEPDIIPNRDRFNRAVLLERLNAAGEEGWEAVASETFYNPNYAYSVSVTVLMKRSKRT